jgi:acid phosphatase family membrane protein YuiD
MDYSYLITPFAAWFFAGIIKFIINSFVFKKLAFSQIGYGGMPSNHSAIVSSMVMIIAIKAGIGHPAFGASITFAFVVILDAYSLRRQIGKHAEVINKIASIEPEHSLLRERIGHTRMEILNGIIVGVAVAVVISFLSDSKIFK